MPGFVFPRFVLAGLAPALWLVPVGLNWLSGSDVYRDLDGWERSVLEPVLAQLDRINAVSLLLAVGLLWLGRPAEPAETRLAPATTTQRLIAAVVDISLMSAALAMPALIILLALNSFQISGDIPASVLGHAHTASAGGLIFPGWILYTAFHLAFRLQTPGQYVAGYRLVHAGPPSGWGEPFFQTWLVLRFGVTDASGMSRHIDSWTSIQAYHRKRDAGRVNRDLEWLGTQNDDQTPAWYRRAGIKTEQLSYQKSV
ncbi:RDD family protein [Maricaulis parjimensis]|uniref:RDD family protein n=1 Tax=Maricaulis parjimensis TaxID=144023 RepID=UPI001939DF48|nr:RDD family protein [Maricaulis parjimensis]